MDNEPESVIKHLEQRKTHDKRGSPMNYTKPLKRKMTLIHLKLFQYNERETPLPNIFYEVSITDTKIR